LIVLDGSDIPFPESVTKQFPDNVKYIHSKTTLTERILIGSEIVNTKFAALAFDDEFYLPEAVAAHVKMLEGDTDLVSVMGNVVGFTSSRDKYFFQYIYPEIKGYGVHEQNSQERITNHLNPYRMTSLTAIIRAEVFLKNAKVSNLCAKMPYSTMFEIGFEIANSFQGKSRVDSILYWFRSFENLPSWSVPKEKIWIWWDDYRKTNEAREISMDVQKILTDSSKRDSTSVEESILFTAMSDYCQGVKNDESLEVERNSFARFRKPLARILHDDQIYAIKNFAKRFVGRDVVHACWVPFEELEAEFRSSGIKIHSESAKNLLSFLEQYPKIK